MPEKYLPGWASPGNWLGSEGHADLKNPVDDPSLCNLCSFPLKLFNDETEIMSSLNVFHLLTILSVKKYCLTSVILQKKQNIWHFWDAQDADRPPGSAVKTDP